MARLKVKVDQKLCTGEALCTGIAPAFFELYDAGGGEGHKALVKTRDGKTVPEAVLAQLSDDDYDTLLEAAERCPPEAIYIWDEDTGEQLFP
ncbi:MAG: ferredoxin [Myxococcales bacterium]|nr:ferredoxin [Myxococcales bacterium]